jgi:hypothetical protein
MFTYGQQWPDGEVGHSPPSSAEVKHQWSYVSIPPYAFACTDRDSCPVTTVHTCSMWPLCWSVWSQFEFVQQVPLPAAMLDCYLCESTWSRSVRPPDSSLFKNSACVSSLMNYIKVSMWLGSVSEGLKLSPRIRTLRPCQATSCVNKVKNSGFDESCASIIRIYVSLPVQILRTLFRTLTLTTEGCSA